MAESSKLPPPAESSHSGSGMGAWQTTVETRLGEIREDIRDIRVDIRDLRTEFHGFRSEVHAEFQSFRADVHAESMGQRTESTREFSQIRAEVGSLREAMQNNFKFLLGTSWAILVLLLGAIAGQFLWLVDKLH